MKPLTSISVALLLLAMVAKPAHALEAGDQVPDVELRGGSQATKLSAYQGKVVYLDFWASWCGPCKQSFPWMNEMQDKYQSQGFEVVAINLDAKQADADRFLGKVPARFIVAFDQKGESARQIGVKGMPTSLLIGRDGKLIHQHAGFNGEGSQKLEQLIQAAVTGGK